jgi:hypothetical protein
VGHVDFGPQHMGAIVELPGAHALKQIEVFIHRTVAVRALFARFRKGAAILADVVGAEAVHVGLAVFDQAHGKAVELFKIIGGIKLAVLPVESQPVDIRLDGVHVLNLLFGGIGVVEAQVAGAPVLPGQAEIQADGFGMADVQVPVGLRREAGGHGTAMGVFFKIFLDDGFDEI